MRAKEKEARESLIKNMHLLARSLGHDSLKAEDSPLPMDDELNIMVGNLESIKEKLQSQAAETKALMSNLDGKISQLKKSQLKLEEIKSQKEPLKINSRLNPLGNVPFTQLITPFSNSSHKAMSKSCLADSSDSANDEIEYFNQLLKDMEKQGEDLNAELLVSTALSFSNKPQKFQNISENAARPTTPTSSKGELTEKIFALSRHEMRIRHRLNSALKNHDLSYPLRTKKTEHKKADLGLGKVLFDQNYIPQPKQDDVLFEIASNDIKHVDLSKLKRK